MYGHHSSQALDRISNLKAGGYTFDERIKGIM